MEIQSSKMNTAIYITLCIVSSLGCLEAEPLAEMQREGFVYVLEEAGSNFFKVGLTSQNIAGRIKQLQTGNPQKILCRSVLTKGNRCGKIDVERFGM